MMMEILNYFDKYLQRSKEAKLLISRPPCL